jgi:hypothetical protein
MEEILSCTRWVIGLVYTTRFKVGVMMVMKYQIPLQNLVLDMDVLWVAIHVPAQEMIQ